MLLSDLISNIDGRGARKMGHEKKYSPHKHKYKNGTKNRRIFFSMNYKFDCDAYKMIKRDKLVIILLNINMMIFLHMKHILSWKKST